MAVKNQTLKTQAKIRMGYVSSPAHKCTQQRLRIAIRFGGSDIMAAWQFETSAPQIKAGKY
jgi:hypothetical protein